MDRGHQSSEHIQDQAGRQYHIGVAAGEVAPFIMLVGDPARAATAAELMESVVLERRRREFVTYTGTYGGLPLSVVAIGMGAGNAEIAVVELCQCIDRPTMIRCGTSGGLSRDVALGDMVITQAAYRLESTSLEYVGEGYPAVADLEVTLSLMEAAAQLGVPHHLGITATTAGFYGAQGRDLPGFPVRHPDILKDLARQGIKNMEMETSCLLTLASLRGFRAGAVCAVLASRHDRRFISPEEKELAERRCVGVGLHAFENLARLDRERGVQRHWHPGLRDAAVPAASR
jgi:uridine phosphorylase